MKFITLLFIGFFVSNIAFSQTTVNDTIIDYIKSESIGGKLDFKQKLIDEGKDKTLLVYDGLAYNPDHFSILLWGQAVKRLGLTNFKETCELWQTIYKKELTPPAKKALKKGFKTLIK